MHTSTSSLSRSSCRGSSSFSSTSANLGRGVVEKKRLYCVASGLFCSYRQRLRAGAKCEYLLLAIRRHWLSTVDALLIRGEHIEFVAIIAVLTTAWNCAFGEKAVGLGGCTSAPHPPIVAPTSLGVDQPRACLSGEPPVATTYQVHASLITGQKGARDVFHHRRKTIRRRLL